MKKKKKYVVLIIGEGYLYTDGFQVVDVVDAALKLTKKEAISVAGQYCMGGIHATHIEVSQ